MLFGNNSLAISMVSVKLSVAWINAFDELGARILRWINPRKCCLNEAFFPFIFLVVS